MAKLMPPDWEPPYPAYVSDIAEAMTLSLTAVQAPSEKDAAVASSDLARLLAGAEGLLHSESVFFDDERGCRNQIAISYWTGRSAFDRWRAGAAVATFVGAERDDDLGIWLECMSCPRDRFEINNSTKTIKWGVSRHYGAHEDPVHGYYGAMRDRIAAAEDGGLPGARGRLGPKRAGATRGRHLTVDLPDNLCFIRTVQGWANCPDEERAHFLQRTYPVYLKGVKFLQSHPVKTNCISARLVTHVGDDPQLPQTETIAWFLSLADLENWAWNHPTHAAISLPCSLIRRSSTSMSGFCLAMKSWWCRGPACAPNTTIATMPLASCPSSTPQISRPGTDPMRVLLSKRILLEEMA